MSVRSWLSQIWHAHHNARVIVDFERRMACLLEKATGGALSKPYYDWPTMQVYVDDFLNKERDEAFEEGKEVGICGCAS